MNDLQKLMQASVDLAVKDKRIRELAIENELLCRRARGEAAQAHACAESLAEASRVSKGVCPLCAPKYERDLKRYGEMYFLRDRARPGETFHAFIMRIRGGNNTVRVYSADSVDELFNQEST